MHTVQGLCMERSTPKKAGKRSQFARPRSRETGVRAGVQVRRIRPDEQHRPRRTRRRTTKSNDQPQQLQVAADSWVLTIRIGGVRTRRAGFKTPSPLMEVVQVWHRNAWRSATPRQACPGSTQRCWRLLKIGRFWHWVRAPLSRETSPGIVLSLQAAKWDKARGPREPQQPAAGPCSWQPSRGVGSQPVVLWSRKPGGCSGRVTALSDCCFSNRVSFGYYVQGLYMVLQHISSIGFPREKTVNMHS